MSTAEIKVTGRRHGSVGLTNEINYIGDKSTQAHDLKALPKKMRNQRIYQKRNIDIGGVGVYTDTGTGTKGTIHDFKLLAKKRPSMKVKTLDLVISPQKGTVNPKDYEQVHQFMNFCKNYVRKAFPNHLAYIAIQFDNYHRDSNNNLRGGIPHAHLIISNLSDELPYKALSSKSYGIYHLRRVYNQQRIIFNHQQNAIHLGAPALLNDTNNHYLAPIFEISNDSQSIMNNLGKGEYTNKTQLKKAFRTKGIILKFHDFRHRKYQIITSNSGRKKKKYVYRKYQTGKHKGQFMWRKSKHGWHKVPVYTHTHGITLHYAKSTGYCKRHYVKGSDVCTFDNRFKYQHIMNCINHALELKRKYEFNKAINQDEWKVDNALAKQGPIPSSITSNSSNSASVDPISSAYAHNYSSAVSTISASGIDLASITPRPLSSVSYNPVTERALASVANNPFNSTTLNSFSSIENTFNEPSGAVASGATTENGLHEEYKVSNFMPRLSKSKVQQGAYLSLKNIYPEYLVDEKTGKYDNSVIFCDFDFTRHDTFLINGLFNHISNFVQQTAKSADDKFIKMRNILHKKAKSMYKWLDKRAENMIPTRTGSVFLNLRDIFKANDDSYKTEMLSKGNNLSTRIHVNYHKNILINIKNARNQIIKRVLEIKRLKKKQISSDSPSSGSPGSGNPVATYTSHISLSQAPAINQRPRRKPQGPTLG